MASCLAKKWWLTAAAGPGELLLQEAHHAYQTLDVEPDKIKCKISTVHDLLTLVLRTYFLTIFWMDPYSLNPDPAKNLNPEPDPV